MRTRTWRLWLVLSTAGVACRVELPLTSRTCPCIPGWTCCSAKNVCVPSAEPCVDAPSFCPSPVAADQVSESGPMSLRADAGPDDVVTPTACSGDGSTAGTVLSYVQPFTPDPSVVSQVQDILATMSLTDEAAQMRGTKIDQYLDIERSADTATIRGFRYRDGPRGMNLGQDLEGKKLDAAIVDGSSVGFSTAFPVSIARGASFDVDLEHAIGEAIGDELQAVRRTVLLAPCVNLLRHPLWGRAQETYGEDPFLVGRLGSAMAIGVQRHVLAVAKHFVAYDMEDHREFNDSLLDEQTLRETYGRPFRMAIQDGGVGAVMAAYSAVNGTKSALNRHLLTDILRTDFRFRGFVLSDWWAIGRSLDDRDRAANRATATQAVKAGLDLELPWTLYYSQLESLVGASDGPAKDEVDQAAARILEQKLRFNAHNLDGNVGLGAPTTSFSGDQLTCEGAHASLAQRAAREGMVLLKNDEETLPLKGKAITKLAVLGATVPYHVTDGFSKPPRSINFATGILTGDLGSSRVFSSPSNRVSPFTGIQATAPPGVTVVSGSTAADALDADFVVVVAGLTPEDEGEEYTALDKMNGDGDRLTLALDGRQTAPAYQHVQDQLIASVAALHKPMVVVLEGGSVIDMLPWLDDVPAVVMAWYPGQAGGQALGQLLWGEVDGVAYNFSGKLPLTWGKRLLDYPVFRGAPNAATGTTTVHDYNVGYRYFDQVGTAPLFSFGHGLSYTSFEYRKLQLGCTELSQGAVLPVIVDVANTGTVAGDETVMVFVGFRHTEAPRRPKKELKGFARVHLEAGEERQLIIAVRLSDLDYFQMDSPTATTGAWIVESGELDVLVGGSAANLPLTATVKVNGYAVP